MNSLPLSESSPSRPNGSACLTTSYRGLFRHIPSVFLLFFSGRRVDDRRYVACRVPGVVVSCR